MPPIAGLITVSQTKKRATYQSFKRMYADIKKTIDTTLKDVEYIKELAIKAKDHKLFYIKMTMNLNGHRQLLNTLMYISIAYWELYLAVRSDCIKCGRAIITL